MTLEEIASGTHLLALPAIGADAALTRQIQMRLGEIGLLDPPADGKFGPVSQWALASLLQRMLGDASSTQLGAPQAKALLDPAAPARFPLEPGADFAGRIARAMQKRGDWICRHPECINIVYVDGTDPDGTPNANAHNKFEDARFVLRVEPDGTPRIEAAWEATTEPGTYYVKTKKLHLKGAAHIVAGQYKAWSVGIHRAGTAGAHESLVQTENIRITRDSDENFDPANDPGFVGMFGINQHWGFDFAREDVRTASAGCLVGRTKSGHRQFMAWVKSDPRFKVNNSYRFLTSVLPPDLVQDEA